jgi:hypothetical protein
MLRKSRRIAGMDPDVRRSFRLAGLDPVELIKATPEPVDPVEPDPVPDISEIYRRADAAAARYEERYYTNIDTNIDYFEYLYNI